MRARPEQTKLEDLTHASVLVKLLVLPANVRLDWKVIARYKHSAYLALSSTTKKKSFIALTPGVTVIRLVLLSLIFANKSGAYLSAPPW